jgi:CheY-like chemotaxis protein
MLIDDDPDQRLLLQMVLKRAGFSVTALESAREALDLIRYTPVQLVICDVQMPDLTGPDFAALLRETEQELNRARVPLLLLTASEDGVDRETASTHADALVTKGNATRELGRHAHALLIRRHDES